MKKEKRKIIFLVHTSHIKIKIYNQIFMINNLLYSVLTYREFLAFLRGFFFFFCYDKYIKKYAFFIHSLNKTGTKQFQGRSFPMLFPNTIKLFGFFFLLCEMEGLK